MSDDFEIPAGLVLRDTLIYTESGEFRKDDYPWLKAVRVIAKGGDAAKPDGSQGDDGYVMVELYGDPE